MTISVIIVRESSTVRLAKLSDMAQDCSSAADPPDSPDLP